MSYERSRANRQQTIHLSVSRSEQFFLLLPATRYEIGALEEMATLTQGYPYFLQEWGYQTWKLLLQCPSSASSCVAKFQAFQKMILTFVQALKSLAAKFFGTTDDRHVVKD